MGNKTVRCVHSGGGYIEVPVDQLQFRPSAYAIIISEQRVLMIRLKNGKLWLPGGGIELGERVEVALTREVAEETGLKMRHHAFWGFRENFMYGEAEQCAYHVQLIIFTAQVERDGPLSEGDPSEGTPEWVDLGTVREIDCQDIAFDIIRHFMAEP